MPPVPSSPNGANSAFCTTSPLSRAVLQMVERLFSISVDAENDCVRSLNTSVRERSAEETLRRIAPILHQFGVSELIDVTMPGVSSCPVFQVVREDMRSGFLNAGKGYTAVESMVSGLMEAIEVHCFERADPRVAHLSNDIGESERSLRIVPTAALLGAQLREQADWPLTPTRMVKGWDLESGKGVWMKARDVFFSSDPEQSSASTANGIASGNSVAEALCHAIGEILERHALAAYTGDGKQGNSPFYQQRERVCAPPDSARMQKCLAELRAKNIDADFLLISREAGVSVFICTLSVPIANVAQRAAVQGFGAHPDAGIAMARALAEAVQILALCPVAEMKGATDTAATGAILTSKQLAELDPSVLLGERIAAHAWLDQSRSDLTAIEFDFLDTDDISPAGNLESTDAALQRLVSGLKSMGCSPIYYCVISPPELPVVVVKCFCPGLDCIANL